MKKLISMTEFVLEQNNTIPKDLNLINNYKNIVKYANFINQDLNIGMFVPAVFKNGEWVVLEEPICDKNCDLCDCMYSFNLYEEAKENVLFAGFDLIEFTRYYILTNDKTAIYTSKNFKFSISQIELNKIEDLIKYEIPLTENAIKLLGL